MAALSIRGLDDAVKEKLRVRAAENGRSMEAEVRAILTDATSEHEPERDLFDAMLDEFGAIGGIDLDLPPRSTEHRPVPDFS